MRSFEALDNHLGQLPANLVNALAAVERGRGREELYRAQSPVILENLRQIAMVQSVEASNAIEDIHVPNQRLRDLVWDKTTPENRSEAEIAGYRRVLNEIHTNGENIPFTANVVKQLHGWLLELTPEKGGEYKLADNLVEAHHPDGTTEVRFSPVSAADTPRYMQELHELFESAWNEARYQPLLLAGSYVLDFLVIHPFRDGNGRVSRLLTALLLHHGNYGVGQFISWEKLIEETKETYYESLARSTAGWHDGEHDLLPWLSYFLGVMAASYGEFEKRAGMVSGSRGSKTAMITDFVRTNLSTRFTVSDVRRRVPHVSDVQIGRVLRDLKERGVLEQHGKGRGSYWLRVRDDF